MPRAKALPVGAPTEPIWFLRALPYSEYRQTNWWRARRASYTAAVVDRCGVKQCELCGLQSFDDLDIEIRFSVHHVSYERLAYELDDDLRLLCSPCHNLVHFPDSYAARHWVAFKSGFDDWDIAARAAELRPAKDAS